MGNGGVLSRSKEEIVQEQKLQLRIIQKKELLFKNESLLIRLCANKLVTVRVCVVIFFGDHKQAR